MRSLRERLPIGRRGGRPSRPTTAVVLGTFAIVGVALGAFVGASRGDAPLVTDGAAAKTPSVVPPASPAEPTAPTRQTEPTTTTTTARTSAGTTESRATPSPADLVGLMPADLAARCRTADALDALAAAAIVCDLDAPAMRLELRAYATSSARNGRFAELAGAAPSGAGAPRCARGRAEVRTWSHRAAPAVVAGVYACHVRDGAAEVVWTDDALGILGIARARRVVSGGGDLAALFEWWRTDAPGTVLARPRPTDASGP